MSNASPPMSTDWADALPGEMTRSPLATVTDKPAQGCSGTPAFCAMSMSMKLREDPESSRATVMASPRATYTFMVW
jgi:hypothetical protein